MFKKILLIIFIFISFCFVSFADEKDDLIEELQLQNTELISILLETTNSLETTSIALAESNDIIVKQKDQIEKDQIEIEELRQIILDHSINDFTYFSVGFGVTYPKGGQVLATFILPKLPIGFFIDTGINVPEIGILNFYFTGGITFSF